MMAKIEFGQSGLQYFICGRYSLFCSFIPVTGNLFHHAIEMFLKMGLLKYYTQDELKIRFGHNLTKLWNEFKIRNSSHSLGQFDQTIADLNKWEDVRYPSSDYRLMSLGLIRRPMPSQSRPGPLPKHYRIALRELDELVKVIFGVSQIDSKIFKNVIAKTDFGFPAKQFYEFENQHRLNF